MAAYTTVEAVGEREELSNIITRIDPADTPVYSNAKKGTASSIHPEWQVQELASASTSNYQVQGFDPTYATPTPTVRVGNYTQISFKDARVSGTLEAVDKAGRDSEIAYQKVLKGLELRRDIEASLLADQGSSSSEPKKAGTLSSWITNYNYSTSGTSTFTGVGLGTAAPTFTGSNNRSMVIDFFDDALEQCYTDGGKPSIAVMSPRNKRVFSNLGTAAGVAANQFNQTAVKDTAYIGSVSVYLSDFGQIDVVVDRFYADNDRVYLLDTGYYEILTLTGRNMKTEMLAKTGDAENFMILSEWTLKVGAPKAHGAVYDLAGT